MKPFPTKGLNLAAPWLRTHSWRNNPKPPKAKCPAIRLQETVDKFGEVSSPYNIMATAKQTEIQTVKVYRNKGWKTSEVYNNSILKIKKHCSLSWHFSFLFPKTHQDSRLWQIREKRIKFYFFKRYSNWSVMSNASRVYFSFSLSVSEFTALRQWNFHIKSHK